METNREIEKIVSQVKQAIKVKEERISEMRKSVIGCMDDLEKASDIRKPGIKKKMLQTESDKMTQQLLLNHLKQILKNLSEFIEIEKRNSAKLLEKQKEA